MIAYKKVDPTYFPQYDMIPMIVHVSCIYRIEKINRGLGGFHLVETPAEPYVKDFCTGDDESVTRWLKWDLTNWAFFMAFDDERPVAGASDDCNMMWHSGINVLPEYRGRGIAAALTNRLIEPTS
jgi:GNAT superfamily N-acetyltransferase